MSPSVLALVLGSAVVHASWNLWAKQIGGASRSAPLLWLLTAISSVCYAPFAWWILRESGWQPSPVAMVFIVGSGAIHVGYFVLLLRGYRVGDLSLVYPLARGTGPLLATAGAVVLLAEKPTVLSVSGALLIALGVLIVASGGPRSDSPKHALGAGVRYGLATGVAIAVYTLWDGWGVKRAGVPPLVFYWGGEVVRVLLLSPVALREPGAIAQLWRVQRWRVLGVALLSPLSYILILLAMRHGDVGHIAPAREVSILFGAYLGGRVLGEGDRGRRLVAAAAFAAGVIALALA
ncbi:MAG: DMT family transporter [Candidatus Eisenbacteria bacterium]|nr:DMT family transporter [Candidatus Eisenbacteria bacterium]